MALLITVAGIYDMLFKNAVSGPLIDLTYAVVVGYIGIHGVAVGAKTTNAAAEQQMMIDNSPANKVI